MRETAQPLHVVHIIPTLTYGGAERFVVDLINASDPAQVRFTIIILQNNQPLSADIQSGKAEIIVVPKRGKISILLFFELQKTLRRLHPDVVHTHLFGGDFWGRVAAHYLHIPVVTTEHNTNVDESVWKRFIKRRLRTYSQIYTAPSKAVADFATATYGISKVIVTKFGIPLTKFNLAPPTFTSPVRMLLLGRLEPQKGHTVALSAFAKLKHLDWHLTIVGAGSLLPEIQGQIKTLQLTKRVQILPPTRDVAHLLVETDVLILPSLWEGLGIVVMEAMAAGRLVVASRVGGVPELIRSDENGLLVSPGSSEELAKALQWVIEHPKEAKTMAKAAKEHAVMSFGIQKMADEYTKIYEELFHL